MDETTEVIWEDPPPVASGRPRTTHWDEVVDTLKEKPGEWALVGNGGTHPGSFGSIQKKLKRLGCEAVQRKVSDTEWKLYARWPEPEK